MKKERIIEILGKWNLWARDLEVGIPRDEYASLLSKFIKTDKVISIIGVRRAGKSTIMKQVAKHLLKEIPKESILIVNLEDPEFEGATLQDLQAIYESYLEIVKPKGKPFIFLDEIQNVPKWEKFVRSLNEQKEAFIIVTGSSSNLLSEELATILTGRQLYFEVFPLSFKEFLKFNGIEISTLKDILTKARAIKSLLRDYLEFGGYPEIALNKDSDFRNRTLVSYYEDILIKDVIRRFKIKEIEKLRGLTRFYFTNISSLITFNSISRFLELPVETIRRFTSYIETSKALFFIKRFSFKIKEQEKSPRKIYTIDVGLSNTLGFRFSENLGRLAENLVAIQLKRMQAKKPMIEIYYWKDLQKEVDFVLKDNSKVRQLFQVCWNVSDYLVKKREIEGLLKASKQLKCKNLAVITEDYEAEENHEGVIISFTPLWKWLLAECKSYNS